MKKLNKLQINSDRLMNNEELITLRGGYDVETGCFQEGWVIGCMGTRLGDTCSLEECMAIGGHCVQC
jgi:hypothetical protein